jgi:hypothetical protein
MKGVFYWLRYSYFKLAKHCFSFINDKNENIVFIAIERLIKKKFLFYHTL